MSRAHKNLYAADDFARLVADARLGLTSGFGELLQQYRPLLLRMADDLLDPRLHSKRDKLDLAQEVFLKVLENVPKFRGQALGQLVDWMKRIMGREVTKAWREFARTGKRAIEREVELSPAVAEDLEAPERCDWSQRLDLLWQIISVLPAEQLLVVLLHDFDGMSFKQIAGIMKRSENAVRKLHQRALRRCRQEAARMN